MNIQKFAPGFTERKFQQTVNKVKKYFSCPALCKNVLTRCFWIFALIRSVPVEKRLHVNNFVRHFDATKLLSENLSRNTLLSFDFVYDCCTLDVLKVLSNNSSMLVSPLERTFPTCSAPNFTGGFFHRWRNYTLTNGTTLKVCWVQVL